MEDRLKGDKLLQNIAIDPGRHKWDDTCEEGVRNGMKRTAMEAFRGMVAWMLAMGATMCVAQNTAAPAPHAAKRASELVVTGYDGQAPVIQHNGHAYVEIEGLARITESSLGFHGSRIVLTLPTHAVSSISITPSSPPAAAPSPAPTKEEKGYSREFLRAGIEEMTVIREWRSAIENAIRTNNPVDQSWIAGYRSNAQSRMAMATASATTDSDRQGVSLLEGALGMVQQLSDRFLSLRSNLTYVSPDTLDNDPLDQKILACAQGMAAQAIPGGQFQDVNACH